MYASKIPVDIDIKLLQRTHREFELNNWRDELEHKVASTGVVKLSPNHLWVIRLLREHYLEHGTVESGRDLGDMLNKEFASRGGRKFFHELFPEGPATQGCSLLFFLFLNTVWTKVLAPAVDVNIK